MKKTIKNVVQKIILIVCLLVISAGFVIPNYVHADITKEPSSAGGTLAAPIKNFVTLIPDAIMNLIRSIVFADSGKFKAATEGLTFDVTPGAKAREDGNWWDDVNDNDVAYPGYLYVTPEAIFRNKISFLNADFVNGIDNYNNYIDGTSYKTSVDNLRKTISNWYKGIRMLALVGLLSVLVYVGIRIILSSASANDKAKYKQMFTYWLSAIVLLFTLHYIMSFTFLITNKLTQIIGGNGAVTPIATQNVGKGGGDNTFTINSSENESEFNTYLVNVFNGSSGKEKIFDGSKIVGVANFSQYARLYSEIAGAVGWRYLIVYIALIAYTVYFFIVYTKRVIYIAFLTLIAPLITLTYPLDKLNDGQAQAFSVWIKEFVFNALLQPFHLLIYTIFVSSAMDFAANNLIYTIVVLGFMIPAEKLLRKMFGFDKATTAGAFSGAAAGSLGANAISKAGNRIASGRGGNGGNNGSSGGGSNSQNDKPVRTAEQEDPLDAFNRESINPENRDNNQVPEGENPNALPPSEENDDNEQLTIITPESNGQGGDENLLGAENNENGQEQLQPEVENEQNAAAEEEQLQGDQQEENSRHSVRRGFVAIGGKISRKIGNATGIHMIRGFGKMDRRARAKAIARMGASGLKTMTPKILRAGTRFTGGLVAGSAAIATGNPKAVASAIALGAKGGATLGEGAGNRAVRGISNTADTFMRGYLDRDYETNQHRRETKKWQNSEEVYNRAVQTFGREDAMEAIEYMGEVRNQTAVTDDDTLFNVAKSTERFNPKHDGTGLKKEEAMSMPKLEKEIGDGVFTDKKKYETEMAKLQKRFMKKGNDTSTAKEKAKIVLDRYAKYKGRELAKTDQITEGSSSGGEGTSGGSSGGSPGNSGRNSGEASSGGNGGNSPESQPGPTPNTPPPIGGNNA